MKLMSLSANPPYQLSEGALGGAHPRFYNKLYISEKTQSPFFNDDYSFPLVCRRQGLDSFREEMLHDDRIHKLVEFENAGEVFSRRGYCWWGLLFLWERDYHGPCEITNVKQGEQAVSTRKAR